MRGHSHLERDDYSYSRCCSHFDGVAAAIFVAVGIVMDVVIGATVLWIILAPICLPKT